MNFPLEPQPFSSTHKVVLVEDPWHPEAFLGTGVENYLPGGIEPRQKVWAAEDHCGNIIGIIAQRQPWPGAVIVFDDDQKLWCWRRPE